MKTVIILLGLVVFLPSYANEQNRSANALLMGGGLKICSSLSQKNCLKKTTFEQQALSGIYYQANKQRLRAIQQAWKEHFLAPMSGSLILLLERFNLRHAEKILTRRSFGNKLKDIQSVQSMTGQYLSGEQVLQTLSNEQWGFLLDHYQLARIDDQGKSLEEAVDLTNSDRHSKALVDQFVQLSQSVATQKGKSKATILVSTSSASDVFDAVSFYTQLFQRDHVDVHWLPLEAALHAVWHEQQSCARLPSIRARMNHVFDRERVYPNLSSFQQKMCQNPEYFKQLIATADGLFFNGGDQTLTLQSLATLDAKGTHFSALYHQIKKQFLTGELVLSGSSAGTAVMGGGDAGNQPRPMISNGASLYGFIQGAQPRIIPPALCGSELGCDTDALSYLPSGGFGWLNLAVFDTHFAERNRPYRLARLLHDTNSPVGIGVDENTGLWLKLADDLITAEVLGAGSVWFIRNHEKNHTASTSNPILIDLAVLEGGQQAKIERNKSDPQWQFPKPLFSGEYPWLASMLSAQHSGKVTSHHEQVTFDGKTHEVRGQFMYQPHTAWPFTVTLTKQSISGD